MQDYICVVLDILMYVYMYMYIGVLNIYNIYKVHIWYMRLHACVCRQDALPLCICVCNIDISRDLSHAYKTAAASR